MTLFTSWDIDISVVQLLLYILEHAALRNNTIMYLKHVITSYLYSRNTIVHDNGQIKGQSYPK
jgi:hypothetical protein